jgi:hypothetical protein
MAFNNLTPISIGDGDPVTADVLRKIVENINIIAKGETVTPVQILSTSTTINGGTTVIAPKGLDTTIGSIISNKPLSTDMKSFPVDFGDLTFVETPMIHVTIEYVSAAESAVYVPVTLNATNKGFKILCKAPSGTKTISNAKIHWTASGTLDPKA